MKTDLIFVYGTLRKGGARSLDIEFPNAVLEGQASFSGQLFVIADDPKVGPYPGVTEAIHEKDTVVGDVFRLPSPAENLATLDEYEECTEAFPEPWEYVRRIVLVELAAGGEREVWMYLYNRPTTGLHRVLSGDFLNYLMLTGPGGSQFEV